MSVTLETKLWIIHIWISNSPEVNLHIYNFSCPFQRYVQCSVILSSRYSIWFFANHQWNHAFSGNSEVLHITSTTMYVRIPVFWNVTLHHLIIGYWCFERTGHLHLQSFKAHETSTLEGQTFVKISETTYPLM